MIPTNVFLIKNQDVHLMLKTCLSVSDNFASELALTDYFSQPVQIGQSSVSITDALSLFNQDDRLYLLRILRSTTSCVFVASARFNSSIEAIASSFNSFSDSENSLYLQSLFNTILRDASQSDCMSIMLIFRRCEYLRTLCDSVLFSVPFMIKLSIDQFFKLHRLFLYIEDDSLNHVSDKSERAVIEMVRRHSRVCPTEYRQRLLDEVLPWYSKAELFSD